MKFNPEIFVDERIVEFCDDLLNYPDDLKKCPDKAGVYLFLNLFNDVVYVGKAGGGRLKTEIATKTGTPHEDNAVFFTWARTNSDDIAKEIETEWIKLYQPQNNILEK